MKDNDRKFTWSCIGTGKKKKYRLLGYADSAPMIGDAKIYSMPEARKFGEKIKNIITCKRSPKFCNIAPMPMPSALTFDLLAKCSVRMKL